MPNVIVTFVIRRRMSDAQAIDNSAAFLSKVNGLAEDRGITICLGVFNSRVDHAHAQADRSKFGFDIC